MIERFPRPEPREAPYVPETLAEHREQLKKVVVAFDEAPESESPKHQVDALFDALHQKISDRYLNQLNAPGFARSLLTMDMDRLAQALHFKDDETLADVGPEDRLDVNERGQIVFVSGGHETVLVRPSMNGPEIASFYQGPRRPLAP